MIQKTVEIEINMLLNVALACINLNQVDMAEMMVTDLIPPISHDDFNTYMTDLIGDYTGESSMKSFETLKRMLKEFEKIHE